MIQFKQSSKIMNILSLFVFTSIIFHFSCTKLDTVFSNASENEKVERFFKLPVNATSQIVRITEDLKKQNKLTGFIPTLIKKEGFALWDKSKSTIQPRAPEKTERENIDNSTNSDSLVYIPLVLENTEYVNSFLLVRITASGISIELYRGREYLNYGYGKLDADTLNAEKLAMQIMMMEFDVFNHSEFIIKDDKLFNHHFKLNQLHDIHDKLFTISRNVSEEVTTCTYIDEQDCPYDPCTGPGGTCDGCVLCVGGDWNCETTWQIYFEPPFEPTGGGGGTFTPQYPPGGPYPCNPNPLIQNGLLPCEDGNTTGWTYLSLTPPPQNFNDSIIKRQLHDDQVAIKSIRDSIWNLSRIYNIEYFFFGIINSNGLIDTLGVKTDSLENEVVPNRRKLMGRQPIFDWHTHQDLLPIDRHPNDPADVLSGNAKNLTQNFRSYVDCGDTLYAVVNEDLSKIQEFFRTNNLRNKQDLWANLLYNSTDRRHLGMNLLLSLLGSSSIYGLGLYKSINADKTEFIKLN